MNFYRRPDFLLGILSGVIAEYYFDQRSGARRRSILRDKILHWGRRSMSRFARQSRYLANRAYGKTIEYTNGRLAVADSVDDVVLVERIRAKVGRILSHPKMIRFDSQAGRIRISGYALTHEVPKLYRQILKVPGVRSIQANNVIPVENEKRMSSIASPRGQGSKMIQRLH